MVFDFEERDAAGVAQREPAHTVIAIPLDLESIYGARMCAPGGRFCMFVRPDRQLSTRRYIPIDSREIAIGVMIFAEKLLIYMCFIIIVMSIYRGKLIFHTNFPTRAGEFHFYPQSFIYIRRMSERLARIAITIRIHLHTSTLISRACREPESLSYYIYVHTAGGEEPKRESDIS